MKSTSSTGSDQTDYLNCATAVIANVDTCSQVGDGKSTVILAGDATGTFPAKGLRFDLDPAGGAFILSTGGVIEWISDTAAYVNPANVTDWATEGPASNIVISAPTTAGSTVVKVTTYDTMGLPGDGGSLTITWTASSGVDLDATKSFIATSPVPCPAPGASGNIATSSLISSAPGLNTNAQACVWVLMVDGNGKAVVLGASDKVVMKVAGVGIFNLAQTVTKTDAMDSGPWTINSAASPTYGAVTEALYATNTQGTATLSADVTYRGKTYSLTPVTFSFTGALASLTASGGASVAVPGSAKVYVAGKDSLGGAVSTTSVQGTSSKPAVATVSLVPNASDADGTYATVSCLAKGQTDITFASGSIKSNAVTITCGATAATTVTLAANTTNVASGSTTVVGVVAKDKDGLPVTDGKTPSIVVAAGGFGAVKAFANGAATFAFVAPNTQGPVTVWAFVDGVGGSLTFTVGTGSSLVITNANKLNLPTAAPSTYTTATEVAAFGKYVTWRGFAGTQLANANIGVEIATKAADGTWSAFTRLTSRTADANGVVLFYWRESAAKWISIRFVGPAGNTSNAVQARWR